MPRGEGVAIKLYGPDKQHGAIKRAGFKSYKWYAVWHENGRQHQRSTGIEYEPGTARNKQVDRARQVFYEQNRQLANNRTSADSFLITDALTRYGQERVRNSASQKPFVYHVKPLVHFFQGRSVNDLNEALLRDYVKTREVQPATARRELESLQAALNYCVTNKYLDATTFKLWVPPKGDRRDRWLTRDEAARLIRAARQEPQARHHLPLFILIAIYTGGRSKSILNLQWKPNTKGGHIDIDKSVINFNASGRAQTNKRMPTIPIPRRLKPLLRALHTRSTVYVTPYVIEKKGAPMQSITNSFASAATRAGLEDVVPHTLRHTAVTWLLRDGEEPWNVTAFTGMSLNMLIKHYGHHCPEKLRGLADRI